MSSSLSYFVGRKLVRIAVTSSGSKSAFPSVAYDTKQKILLYWCINIFIIDAFCLQNIVKRHYHSSLDGCMNSCPSPPWCQQAAFSKLWNCTTGRHHLCKLQSNMCCLESNFSHLCHTETVVALTKARSWSPSNVCGLWRRGSWVTETELRRVFYDIKEHIFIQVIRTVICGASDINPQYKQLYS